MNALNNVFDVKVGSSQVRKIFLGSNLIWNLSKPVVVPSNEIWYTSTDGKIVVSVYSDRGDFNVNVNLVSNTYENGKGVMAFDGDVTTIGYNTFRNCSRLASITIPDSVTSIEWGAFNSCTNLKSITIPNSVTNIGGGAFAGCDKLTSVNIPDNVTSIEDATFSGCSSLTSITIPDSVNMIGIGAFVGCSLTSVTIPDSVTTIGNDAFYGCSLTSVTIPDSVTTIGSSVFSGCKSLTSVIIGNGVTTIGEFAFRWCDILTSVYCKPTTPPKLVDSFVFDDNGSGRKIYVPIGSGDLYRNAVGWNEYADQIVEYDYDA